MEIDADIRDRLAGRTMILGVGAQKCGTSWMHLHLASRRKQIAAAPLKEMHFFDAWLRPRAFGRHERFFRRRAGELTAKHPASRRARAMTARAGMIDDRAAYLRHFAEIVGKRPFLMEITPCYALLSGADFRQVRAYFEAAGVAVRPLLLMRDPVARIVSHHRSAHAEAGGGHDVTASLRRSISRLPGRGDQLRRSRYDLTLKSLWRAFGEDAVSVGFYETMFEAPDIELRRVIGSLGLRYAPPDVATRVNPSPDGPPVPDALIGRAVERLRPVYDFVAASYPDRKPAAWLA